MLVKYRQAGVRIIGFRSLGWLCANLNCLKSLINQMLMAKTLLYCL